MSQTPADDSAATVAGFFRQLLECSKWKENSMQKVTDLRIKYVPGETDRTKGSGGCVSSVRRAQMYTTTVANLLRAAISPAGPALIHGSVALTYMLESDRCSVKQIAEENQTELFNVQQTPFVNLEHNVTMRAYQGWQDTRHSLALEQQMLEEARRVAFKRGSKSVMNKRAQSFNRSLLKMKLRAALRSDCLTTMRVTYNETDAEKARNLYGSDVVVISVITYRKMPAEVQAEVNERKITEQQVIDVVMKARKRYEAYFASREGIYNCERRMRTVPASSTFNYFDQTTYFENSVMPRVCEAVNLQLCGAAAVRHVFPIEKDGDENQCQRAFGHWMLNEFGKLFGTDFQTEYKYRIVGHACNDSVRALCAELLCDVEQVLTEFEKVLNEVIDPGRVIVTKRARVAAAATSTATDAEPDAAEEAPSPPKKKKKCASSDSETESTNDEVCPFVNVPNYAECASALKVGLSVSQKRTKKQLEAEESLRKTRAAFDPAHVCEQLPKKNASLWPMQFPSSTNLLKPVVCKAQVDAAANIVQRLGVMQELERKNLRRTALEVSVGDHLIQTATNATTAAVREAAVAARLRNQSVALRPDDDAVCKGGGGGRDVGVDSRRMLNEAATKPIPLSAVIQHANPQTGEVNFLEIGSREYAHYRINTFDVNETLFGDVHSFDRSNPCDVIKFLRSVGTCHIALAANVSRALQMSRAPARADSETDHALMRSETMEKYCTRFIEDTASLMSNASFIVDEISM